MSSKVALSAWCTFMLAGCASTQPPSAEPPQPPASGACDAAPVQTYLGTRAGEEVGAWIMAESGAALLRWGPPDSAWTMDYREDRVNVRYDDDMVITAITCG